MKEGNEILNPKKSVKRRLAVTSGYRFLVGRRTAGLPHVVFCGADAETWRAIRFVDGCWPIRLFLCGFSDVVVVAGGAAGCRT